MGFPHPVLCNETNDYPGCTFDTSILSVDDGGDSIQIEIEYIINCEDIQKLIEEDKAYFAVRITCAKTSYRELFEPKRKTDKSIIVEIEKQRISDQIGIQSYVVAKEQIDSFLPLQRNNEYFGSIPANIKKGDILALELGRTIKLDSEYEREVSGVVLITEYSGENIDIKYASADEEGEGADYITIRLPNNTYDRYSKLRKRKLYKKDVERFLQATVVLPAIVEAVTLLKYEQQYDLPEDTYKYSGALWAESIEGALRKKGIDLRETNQTGYELANCILKDVVGDSLNDLIRKMDDIANTFQEDV